jgi:DNA replication and repair protein RecF
LYLTHISLTNFRNFARLDVDVPRGPIVLVGNNAQGKTSLLEAVYYLATCVSFHASNERQLINLSARSEPLAVARIVAALQRGGKDASSTRLHRLEIRLIQEETPANGAARLRKEIFLDGVKRKLGDILGVFNAVLFLPQMLQVVEGSPEERRRYLNLAMAQVLPHYGDTLSDYNQVLTRRNALLKKLAERQVDTDAAASQLGYWDELLTRNGAQIIHARIRAVQELERLAARLHRELTHGKEILRIAYQPSFDPFGARNGQFALPLDTALDRSSLSIGKIESSFLEHLARKRTEEIERGTTTVGPHRDELRFLSNQLDLGIYGSRGQARSAVLALKLAEVAWMKERSGDWPVLLLDEVLAELDPQRRSDFLTHLLESEQVMMTTTDLEPFSGSFVDKAAIWQIHAGNLV